MQPPVRSLIVSAMVLAGLAAVGEAAQRRGLRALRQDVHTAVESGNYEQAIELLSQLERRSPGQPLTAYNLACCYAVTGRKEEAVAWLRRSADRGFAELEVVRTSDLLYGIRDEPGYTEAVALIAENDRRAFEKFRKNAKAPDPVVILPPALDASKPAPLIVALHGYGATASPIAEAFRQAAAEHGAVVIAPRAQDKVRNAGYQWGEIDEAEFLVLRAIDHVESRHAIDNRRIVLTGFSQGAYVAGAVGLRHPKRFVGVVAICGSFMPDVPDTPPEAADAMPRFFFMAGDRDAATQNMQRAADALAERGAKVKLVIHQNTGHQLPADADAATREALAFVLGGM
jgi:predicted esterase